MLPGGLGRFVPCSVGANHCRLRHFGWKKCGHGLTSRPRESASEHFLNALLGLFQKPQGDPAYCAVWFPFRVVRRYVAHRPSEVGRIYRLLDMVREGCPGRGPVHSLLASATDIVFQWDPHVLGCQS